MFKHKDIHRHLGCDISEGIFRTHFKSMAIIFCNQEKSNLQLKNKKKSSEKPNLVMVGDSGGRQQAVRGHALDSRPSGQPPPT